MFSSTARARSAMPSTGRCSLNADRICSPRSRDCEKPAAAPWRRPLGRLPACSSSQVYGSSTVPCDTSTRRFIWPRTIMLTTDHSPIVRCRHQLRRNFTARHGATLGPEPSQLAAVRALPAATVAGAASVRRRRRCRSVGRCGARARRRPRRPPVIRAATIKIGFVSPHHRAGGGFGEPDGYVLASGPQGLRQGPHVGGK